MNYVIRALKNGQCEVRDYITFLDSESEDTSTFYLYVWVIEGGPRPVVVDTGPKNPQAFAKATQRYIPSLTQLPEERTPELLKRNGVDPADVSHVIVTHLHGDHYDYFDAFANAQLVVSKQGFLDGLPGISRDVMIALAARWPDSLRLVEDEEVLPGIRVFWVGCHSLCSQAVAVQTALGTAVITGDVAYKYENIETDRIISCPDPDECRRAVARIRQLADIVLPAHEPRVLERWPGGVIGRSG